MLLGEVFQSIAAWQKLAGINMRPKLAYRIFKYTKLVSDEYEIAEKQRVALVREITGTKDGEDAKIEPGTEAFTEYAKRFQEIMATETALSQIDLDFEDVVNAVDERVETLTVQDLAVLEPFFQTVDVEAKCDQDEVCTREREVCCDNCFRNEDGTPKEVLNE